MYYADRPIFATTPEEKVWRNAEYRRLRRALSLSRPSLSAVTGLSITTLNQIPYRDKAVSLAVLERMREALEERCQRHAA